MRIIIRDSINFVDGWAIKMNENDNLAAAKLIGFDDATIVLGKCFTANPYDKAQNGRHFTMQDFRDRHLVVNILAMDYSIGFIGTKDKNRWFVVGMVNSHWPGCIDFDYGNGGHDSRLLAVIAAINMVTGTQKG